MVRIISYLVALALATGSTLMMSFSFGPAEARAATCAGGILLPPNTPGEDLLVIGSCTVQAGTYKFGNVNIYGTGDEEGKRGVLNFEDGSIDFWAESILVENHGSLIAGSPEAPISGPLTIHLYGMDQGVGGQGITCQSPDGICGVPSDVWNSNGAGKVTLPGGAGDDYFYRYVPLMFDDGGSTKGFFGYKVLAVSYGGTLQLFGKKGACYASNEAACGSDTEPANSGLSWRRLSGTLQPNVTTLQVDALVDWTVGDNIVVTTTDYLPGHSEELVIAEPAPTKNTVTKTTTINFTNADPTATGAKWIHNGETFPLGVLPEDLGIQSKQAETRAAVALLSRSIRVVSEGPALDAGFPAATSSCDPSGVPCDRFFGGHTIIRQGFKSLQMQGVEFSQLGQGGRMGHYPVHFHLARKTPPGTFVKDCSINESMTRWIVLHGTQNVTLERNVGYKSIGHGYYLEDGTETDNKFYSNIGVFARAAVSNSQNDRHVPGILDEPGHLTQEIVPYHSDYDHPTAFWIMNGWNDFIGNMAVGAGTCGACFWLVPGANSGDSRNMKWESYASLQTGVGRAATSPLKTFLGNYCSTAMNSFNTVGDTNCPGIAAAEDGVNALVPVPNPLAPAVDLGNPTPTYNYYPIVAGGSGRHATRCDTTDCSAVEICANGVPAIDNCMVTVLDHYTSAFHWAETNFAAIWLRPDWYLVTNSVLSDVQNGGLTFVTGGDYTHGSTIGGHWDLSYKNVFIGQTQQTLPVNPYALNAGPFNPNSGLACDSISGNHCLSNAEGILMPLTSFGVNQRLFSIYDGPAYEDSNAYMAINATQLFDCQLGQGVSNGCGNSQFMYGRVLGVPWDPTGKMCYLPNAAIAWKQPNGFYYAPAFHSGNLFFDNVDIRHFVVEPLFEQGTAITDTSQTINRYCTRNENMFINFTDIDRQTELNDDDGSLTGLVKTVSVNEDPFFSAPVEATECASDNTAKTSPYDYVSTVLYPQCATLETTTGCVANCCVNWARPCADPTCYGVPLYRQLSRSDETVPPGIRMMGENLYQRNTLTVNHGTYYMDTTVSLATQQTPVPNTTTPSNFSVFSGGETYYLFFLFAKYDTVQTYQIYVGPGFYIGTDLSLVRADISSAPIQFTPKAWPQSEGKDLWVRDYDPATGILTVTVDMNSFKADFNAAHQAHCQPHSFCSWDAASEKCGCSSTLKQDNPALYKECDEKDAAGESKICRWAGKDLDCPAGGCLGFSFTMPASFSPPAQSPRPAPVCIRSTDTNWNVPWDYASEPLPGDCLDAPVDPPAFCDQTGNHRTK